MNKTKALEILTALVGEGFNTTLVTQNAETDKADTDYVLYVSMPYGSTLEGLRPAQRVLDSHNATLELPGFNVVTDEEIQRRQQEQRAIEESMRASSRAIEEAERQETRDQMLARAGGSEKDGGRSGDFPERTTDDA